MKTLLLLTDKLKQKLVAARIVTGLPIFTSKVSLYFETGWDLLCDRRKRNLE